MESKADSFVNLGLIMKNHGPEMIFALIILITGLLVLKWVLKKIKVGLEKFL